MSVARAPAWAPPLLAVQFLTRVPVPGTRRLSAGEAQDGLSRAVGWFPLVGTLVGLVTASAIVAAEGLWPRAVAVVLALAIEARLTGAFHEDAVADFCDGFGGGYDAEAIGRIMKDSRIGSYGAVGLVFAIGLRATLLVSLPVAILVPAVVASATFGRLLVVALMKLVPPVPTSRGLAKDVGGRVSWRQLALAGLASLTGLAAFAWSTPAAALAVSAAGVLFLLWFRRLLTGRLGGSTGDCLGFAAYAGQLILLLAASAR